MSPMSCLGYLYLVLAFSITEECTLVAEWSRQLVAMHGGIGFESQRHAYVPFCFFLVHTGIYLYIPCLSEYVQVHTSINQYLLTYVGTYWYIPVCTLFFRMYTDKCQYVPGVSQYIQVCTGFVLEPTSLGYYLVQGSTFQCVINTYFCVYGV